MANATIERLKNNAKAIKDAALHAHEKAVAERQSREFSAQVGYDAKEKLVKVKALHSIAQFNGSNRHRGEVFSVPVRTAEILMRDGEVEIYKNSTDLAAAVKAVREAGGDISCDKGNAQLIRIFSEIDEAEGASISNDDGEPDVYADDLNRVLEAFIADAGIELESKANKDQMLAVIRGAGFKVGDKRPDDAAE